MPATYRHRVRDVVAALEETYDTNDTVEAEAYQSACRFNIVFPQGTTVSTNTVANVLPYGWRVEMMSHGDGTIRVSLHPDE